MINRIKDNHVNPVILSEKRILMELGKALKQRTLKTTESVEIKITLNNQFTAQSLVPRSGQKLTSTLDVKKH